MTTRHFSTLGIASHSGWAAVVALGNAPGGPQVLERSRVQLIDEHYPESKQPYHAVEALKIDEAARHLDRYRAQALSMAGSALRQISQNLAGHGYGLKAVGILDSSGRKGSPLRSILASHSLIHTADGDHFRTALASAAEQIGLVVHRVPAKDLEALAELRLHQPPTEMRDLVREIGRQVGAPWGADQKNAALLAWVLLEQ
jgi:hypothetical protein